MRGVIREELMREEGVDGREMRGVVREEGVDGREMRWERK